MSFDFCTIFNIGFNGTKDVKKNMFEIIFSIKFWRINLVKNNFPVVVYDQIHWCLDN